MSTTLRVPAANGATERLTLQPASVWPPNATPPRSRVAFAAAHVVADPRGSLEGGAAATLDWDATLRFRHHLWSLGLGVADAMDTAQRGMGLDWPTTCELVVRSAKEAASVGGALACGAGTDQLPPKPASLAEVRSAYAEQVELIEAAGAQVVLMASPALATAARSAEDYAAVYTSILKQVSAPVILHWLGAPFDSRLAGYWGSADPDVAAQTVLAIIGAHPGRVDGVKVSLLDPAREISLRRELPPRVRLYTGDDFHYPHLIRGDEHGHSDALLGVFDPLAAPAAAALRSLDDGDLAAYDAILEPTLDLARHLFTAPTRHYKTGVVFLAWLAGHQEHFCMVGGWQGARSVPHLVELLRLASAAGLLPDPDLAAARMRALLTVAGFRP